MKIINSLSTIQLDKRRFLSLKNIISNHLVEIIIFILVFISVFNFLYYLSNGLGLSYNDARSHLDIGRRVVEGLKPGFAQIGSVWLPLPHVLMTLTIWNDFMWHSGLAGALQSMISFVATSLIIFYFLKQYRTLRETTPKVIADYHRVSTYLLSLALEPGIRRDSWTLSSLYNVLTYATPPETEVLWKEMIAAGKTKPASSRPDILIPQEPTRPWQHIEYNADGSADKGNTLGVAKVTQEVLGFPTIGIGLDIAFMKGLRRRLPDHDQITVATVVPSAYRTEYTPQNEFFAKQIDGRDSIRWISASLSQMEYRSDGVLKKFAELQGNGRRVVNIKFKQRRIGFQLFKGKDFGRLLVAQ
jgi:hypothetical protein